MAALDDKALDILFLKARTHNGWLDKPVPDELLKQVYDIAKMGATTANSSPMRVVFVKSKEAKEKMRPILDAGNVEKTMLAPVTAIIAQDMEFYEKLPFLFPHTDARSWFAGNKEKRLQLFVIHHCRGLISCWRREHWVLIADQCPGSIIKKWTRHSLPEPATALILSVIWDMVMLPDCTLETRDYLLMKPVK